MELARDGGFREKKMSELKEQGGGIREMRLRESSRK